MKQLITVLALGLISSSQLLGQEGRTQVLDATTGRGISGATISVWGPSKMHLQTDQQGFFALTLPKGQYTLTISAKGYEALQMVIKQELGQVQQIAPIKLRPVESNTNDLESFAIVEDLSEEGGSTSEQSSLLTASRDPFNAASGYVFSVARFSSRGYDSPYSAQLLNGVQMNDLNTGYSVWSLWGGLNDMTRNQTIAETLEPIDAAIGSIGISSNMLMRASLYRAQKRLTYSNSNRTYSNRLMATWATGKMQNGWAVAIGLSRRSGNGEYSYVRGMHYDAWSYFFALEKDLDRYNSLSLIAFGAPTRRGVASASTQEAYDLVESNYYNPNMGRQGGKWRNARERNNHEPVFQLSHYYDNPNQKLKINTTLSYRFGWNSYSSLNWYNAPDPRPDYYRYLPSYYTYMASADRQDPETAELYEELWRSDPNTRYINWDKLYEINRNNTAPLYNSAGQLLSTGARALYMIELRHTDQREFGYASNFNYIASDRLKLDGGLFYRYNKTANYNKVGDLLGASYLYDIDKFAERDFGGDADKAQMDMRNPDHIAVKNDRFGYDYNSVIQRMGAWANLSYTGYRLDAYMALGITQTNMYREGKQQRGLFPNNSLGRSQELRFFDISAKAGVTYKINGQHFLLANLAYVEQAPTFASAFVSPRTRNTITSDLKSEKLLSADLSYAVRLPWLRGRITGFYTRISDKTRSMSFYDDAQASFSNFVLSGIATRHLGVELGLEAKLSPTITATGALALGHYSYDNNPSYVQTIDNSDRLIDQDKVYWKGLMLHGTPQTAATLGLNYRAPWYGTLGINANYFGRNYASMNPVLRTDRARAIFDDSITTPEKLQGGMTLDLYIGYSWMIKRGTFLRFNLSVNNILNNRKIHSSGFEQLRVRTQNDANGQSQLFRPFDSKYSYIYGTTFFFNTSLQF